MIQPENEVSGSDAPDVDEKTKQHMFLLDLLQEHLHLIYKY